MKYFINIVFLLAVLSLVSGCGSRYINHAKETFKQADIYEIDLKKARSFIRSEKEYDQFTTVGLFDVIWFSEDVQEAYRKIKLERFGVFDDKAQKQLDDNIENANKFITFYLLLPPKDVQDIIYTHFDGVTYSQSNVDWNAVIEIDGKRYSPKEFIFERELDPELAYIFGKSANRYRSIYIARFETDINGTKIINKNTKQLKLILRTTKYSIPFIWQLRPICAN